MNLNKVCTKCSIEKPLENFYENKAGYPASKCKPCHAEYQKEYRSKNDKAYFYTVKARYNIDREQYNEMRDNQESKCKICSKEPKRLYIDHCHDSGKIRGLLCHQCNSGLGMFKDNINNLKNAVRYLNEE